MFSSRSTKEAINVVPRQANQPQDGRDFINILCMIEHQPHKKNELKNSWEFNSLQAQEEEEEVKFKKN